MISASLKTEIESLFTVVPEKCTDEEMVFLCPECGDKSGHRSLNLRTGFTFCFRCNKGASGKGHFKSWAKALGFTLSSASGVDSTPFEVLFSRRTSARDVPVVKPVELPDGFTRLGGRPCAYTRLIERMAKRKNLDYRAFVEADAGYTLEMPWEPYCIFPVTEYGMTVYYQGRTYVDVPGETTKKFPSRKEVEFGAANWVYNIDDVRAAEGKVKVIVVESILNVLSLKRKLTALGKYGEFIPVCVFKHYISKIQALKLTQCSQMKELCYLFDHDAIDKTWKSVGDLGSRVSVSVAEMPMLDGNKKMDANDDVDVAWQAIKNRKPYTAATVHRQLLYSEPKDARNYGVSLAGLRIGS